MMRRAFNPTDFPERFGKRLRRARDAKKLSQLAVAERAGFVAPTICHLERGHTVPSLYTVFVLAEVLEVHPKDLLFGEEE